MDEPTMETLARRLDRVEGENRRLKQAGVVALSVIAAVGPMGQATATKVPKVIEAEKFVLLDRSGKERAVLGMTTGGQAALALYDKTGNIRATLGMIADGSTTLALTNQDRKSRVGLAVLPNGKMGLTFSHATSKPQVALVWQPDGLAGLSLRAGKKNKAHAEFDISASGRSRLVLLDKNGNKRVGLAVLRDGSPGLGLFSERGEFIWSAP